MYHSSADRVVKQLEASFARTVNRECPGLADPGRMTVLRQQLEFLGVAFHPPTVQGVGRAQRAQLDS